MQNKIQRKNTKSELQGLENTSGWFCIGFTICFLISTVNTGLALWFIFEFVFSLYFVGLKFWVRIFIEFCNFEIVDSYFFYFVYYHTICKVLGVEFDFTMSGAGFATVNNTADRVKGLCEQLDSIPESGSLKKIHGERD